MSYKNYKKSKLGKLKSFCAVVENEDSILKASEAIMISSSSISKDISSLEKDLGYKLFDRVKNKLLLNKNGQEYYKIAKNIILDLKKAYSPGLENIDKSEIKRVLKRKKIEIIKKKLDNWKMNINKILNKMLVKITWKKVISFFAICILGFFIWAERTNFWFDREMKKLANPLLKEVMENGYYAINKNFDCEKNDSPKPFDLVQFNLDILKLWNNMSEKINIKLTTIGINNCPSQVFRFSGNNQIDQKFNDKKAIICNTKNIYNAIVDMFFLTEKLFKLKTKKFNAYSIYDKTDCLHHDQFLLNVQKFDNLHKIQVDSVKEINNGRFWILKYKKYYYLWIVRDSLQGYNNNIKQERHLIFKKLTLQKLKKFDKNSYWQLIKKYNIQID